MHATNDNKLPQKEELLAETRGLILQALQKGAGAHDLDEKRSPKRKGDLLREQDLCVDVNVTCEYVFFLLDSL